MKHCWHCPTNANRLWNVISHRLPSDQTPSTETNNNLNKRIHIQNTHTHTIPLVGVKQLHVWSTNNMQLLQWWNTKEGYHVGLSPTRRPVELVNHLGGLPRTCLPRVSESTKGTLYTSSFNSLRSNNCNLPLHVQVHLHIKIVSSNGRFLLHKKNFMDESLGISYDVIIHYYIELVLWGVWSGEVA